MTLLVHVFVHPVDTSRPPHSKVQPGFRWCVSLSEDPSDPSGWLNAGWAPTEAAATRVGDTVGVTCAKALQAVGVPSHWQITPLTTDPCFVDLVDVR